MVARGESSKSRCARSCGESSASRLSRIASAVLTSWTTATLPAAISVSIASKTVGIFIEISNADQKRCLELSNRMSADPLAIEFRVRPEARSTILAADRKSVVYVKKVSVSVDLGGRRIINKKQKKITK